MLNNNSIQNLTKEDVLNASTEEKISFFSNYIVPHKILSKVVDETLTKISASVSERIILVCGPTGVGKMEFIKQFKERVFEKFSLSISKKPGMFPVVSVEAIAPEQGSFNFRSLWKTILEELQEPMLESKITYQIIKGMDSKGNSIFLSDVQKADYQKVLQNTLYYRDIKALMINEAQHLLRITSGKRLNESLDVIKSLANGSHTPIILVGNYSLLDYYEEDLISDIRDQVNRRSLLVHFPHYCHNIEEQVREFGSIAKKLMRNMPLEYTAESLVDDNWKYFYQYTLGCIGTLKIWLTDALCVALESNSKTLTRKHLDETKLSGQRSSALFNAIKKGESIVNRIFSEGNIDHELGFSQKNKVSPKALNRDHKIKSKPFERNPKRDDVGLG